MSVKIKRFKMRYEFEYNIAVPQQNGRPGKFSFPIMKKMCGVFSDIDKPFLTSGPTHLIEIQCVRCAKLIFRRYDIKTLEGMSKLSDTFEFTIKCNGCFENRFRKSLIPINEVVRSYKISKVIDS